MDERAGQEWSRRVGGTLQVPRRLARSVWESVHQLAWAAEATPAGLMVPADALTRLGPAAGRLLQDTGVLAGWSSFWWQLHDPTPMPVAGWWDAAEAWLATTAGARALDHACVARESVAAGIRVLHGCTGSRPHVAGQRATRVLQQALVDAWTLEGILTQAGVLHYQDRGSWGLTPPRHLLTTRPAERRVAA